MFYNLFKAHYIYYDVLILSEDLLTLLTEYQKKMHFEHMYIYGRSHLNVF